MGFFRSNIVKIKSWFGRDDREAAPPAPTSMSLRRWESAEKTRQNRAQWNGQLVGQSINADLLTDLETLRTRAAYEVANNPNLEGVLGTFGTDVAGRNGPTLQIQSDKPEWNKAMEAVWRAFWKRPDVRGMLGGVDFLKLWTRNLFINGEFLYQKVTDRRAKGPISLRIKGIAPRRLTTPMEYVADADVILGIRQTPEGKPVAYYISDPRQMGVYYLDVGKFKEVPAEDICHVFVVTEEDQVRGIPWVAVNLQTIADLRSYDASVLKAARNAARFAVMLTTKHVDAPWMDVNEETEISDETISTMPPGWEATQMDPKQPAQNHVEYRSDRMRELGRPAGMPLMMVRLDSREHNYSSARFDSQVYVRGIESVQGWLERRALEDLVADVRREAELYAAANPQWKWAQALRQPPEDVTLVWTWPKFPHVDPQKEANAQDIKLKNKTLSYTDALAEDGKDIESHIETLKRDDGLFESAGIEIPTEAGKVLPEDGEEEGIEGEAEREQLKAEVDQYGVAVRAGTITPQIDDEEHFRTRMALPTMSADAKKAWTKDKGTRRPITLTPPGGMAPAPIGGAKPPATTEDDESEE